MTIIPWNPKMEIIVNAIHILYNLPGCGTGGCCHIVTDDDNIKDEDLKWVIDYCHSDENKNCVDRELSSLICELLLQLSYEQRMYLFAGMNDGLFDEDIDKSIWDYYLDIIKVEMDE